MLRRASVADLKHGNVSRADGLVVVAMVHYPRFLQKELRDEYVRDLAPDPELFRQFKALDRGLGDHDAAFEQVDYEKRFWLSKDGRAQLSRLAALAKERDVILICQCQVDQRCHCDLVLLMARRLHGAKIEALPFPYDRFMTRLEAWAAEF
jgi:uncharacterized protein YeaO (DUF488 family)